MSRSDLFRTVMGFGAMAAALTAAGAAQAQAAPSADLLQKKTLCVQSVGLSGLETQMDSQIKAAVDETYNKLMAVSPAGDETVIAYRDALSGALLAAKAPVIAKLVEACALTFSVTELEDINRFYLSASGKAWLEKGRVIMLPVLERAVEDVGPQVAADLEMRFCAKIDCKPAPPAAAHPPKAGRTL